MSAAVCPAPPKWRWPVAVAAMALLHGAGFLVLRDVHPNPAPEVPQDAVMLDLAPTAPVPAPTQTPAVVPPQQAAPPPPPDPAPPDPPPPPADPPPQAVIPDNPEVVLPPPPRHVAPRPPTRPVPRVRPPPRPVQEPPVQAAPVEAPPAPPAPAAKAPAAPSQASPGAEAATWASKLAAHLLRFRHYPPDAERRGMTGVVMMRFSVDASGHLVSHSMVRSSGHDMLDEEASAWLERAQPLPIPPPERLSPAQIVVPLAFVLH